MFISHRCKFVIFSDPCHSSKWLDEVLEPWSDHPIADTKSLVRKSRFFNGMTPAEAEIAFNAAGLNFADYTRISIVQNPFRRLARLYDRIAATDPIWRLRERAGWTNPEFGEWLKATKSDGYGAGYPLAPRWQRFGAYSCEAWSGGRIDHHIRTEFAAQDLRKVFLKMNLVPAFSAEPESNALDRFPEMLRYDAGTMAIIHERYGSDLKLYHSPEPRLRLVA